MSKPRASAFLRGLFGIVAVLLALSSAGPGCAVEPYVGYDHPEADRGGPHQPQGLVWLDVVWPRRITLASKLPGGPLRLLALINHGGLAYLGELSRYLPVEATFVEPTGEGEWRYLNPDFASLRRDFLAGKKFDVFLISRVDVATIPLDIAYEIMSRVKQGAGLVLQDQWGNHVFSPGYYGLKSLVTPDKQLIPGIPYEGLQQVANTEKREYPISGLTVAFNPQPKPFEFGPMSVYQFGRGTLVSYETNTTQGNMYWGTTAVIPGINTTRDMWSQNDYLFSHTAKALLRASGRPQTVQITGMQPRGATEGAPTPEVAVLAPAGAFSGTLRWQVRDQWGLVTASGKLPCRVDPEGSILRLDGVGFPNAGRQWLDVWIDNAAGETVDWGTTFVDVSRGVAAPSFTLAHEEFVPRGEPLEGTVRVAGAPADAKLTLTLVDRFWRNVGHASGPAGTALRFSFPIEGLSGQIWILQAEVRDAAGRILSRAATNIRSPRTKADFGAWIPTAASSGYCSPEGAAQLEQTRRLGFVAQRSGSGDPLNDEMRLFCDTQSYPTPWHITPGDMDWKEPLNMRDMRAALMDLSAVMKPNGLWGMNLTDDSYPARELPPQPYNMLAFYDWLKAQYGDFDGVCQAWGWTPPAEEVAADDLPKNPYVAVAFHQWLSRKYGDIDGVAKAWKLPAGSLRRFGSIHQAFIQNQRKAGNALPTQDVQAFKAEYAGAGRDEPFGRINRDAIKAANEAGFSAAWIDAARYGDRAWADAMLMLNRAMREVQPDAYAGTDAAFYAHAGGMTFGELNYVAPYFDHNIVKLGAQRGRQHEPGLYGACLGTYGGKPANLAPRRNEIWDCLFSGCTGYMFWCLWQGRGQTYDLKFQDAHALYQLETTEELSRGIGDLVVGCPPLRAPVAMLESEASGLCDDLERKQEPITNKWASWSGFLSACEDLELYPWAITSPELEQGWLKRHDIRVLLLPGNNAMSDREVSAVREFVEDGGTVVADVLPARRYPNGNPREETLASLFGVEFTPSAPDQKNRMRGALTATLPGEIGPRSFGESLADPRIKTAGATAAGQINDVPVLLSATAGKGRAYLLNCAFSAYATYRAEGGEVWAPWYDLMAGIMKTAGVEIPFPFTSQGKKTPGFQLVNFPNGSGYLLGVADLGAGDFTGVRRPVEITLPRALNAYDVRAGKFLGRSDSLKVDLPRAGYRVYALMPYAVKSVEVRADRPTLLGGGKVRVSADLVLDPAGKRDRHVLRVEVFTPKGGEFYPFRQNLETPVQGPLTIPLTFASNDPPGRWRVVVTDVNSGVSGETTVQVEAPRA